MELDFGGGERWHRGALLSVDGANAHCVRGCPQRTTTSIYIASIRTGSHKVRMLAASVAVGCEAMMSELEALLFKVSLLPVLTQSTS